MLKRKIKWSDKTAVITGSASGIGKAIAIALAKKGVMVHLVDLRQKRIVTMLDELSFDTNIDQTNICGHTIDVTVPEQLEQLAKNLAKVDILINCAGILHQGKIATTTNQELHRVIDINFWGVINSIKAFLPQMSDRTQGGHIINIASIAGLISAPEMSLYNASKCAIIGLSESLAIELAPNKIQVAAICPGSVKTNLSRDGLFSSDSTVAQTLRKTIDSGVAPERVALDIIQAIEGSSLFKLSHVELHWQILWWCKRMFPSLYPKFASIFYHKVVDRKWLNFFSLVKTEI